MTSSNSVFSASRKQLEISQSGLAAVPSHDRTHAEMQDLAQLVIAAAGYSGRVQVQSMPGIGFALECHHGSVEAATRVATLLAHVSNYPVFYRRSTGAEAELHEPSGLPIQIMHAPSQFGARHGVAHRLFELLAFPSAKGNACEPTLSLTDSQKAELSQLCTWRIESRPSGLAELIIQQDFCSLLNDSLLGALKELKDRNSPFVVRFEPTFESACLAAHEVFGAQAAWRLEPKDSAFLLTVYKTSDVSESFIADAVGCLEARIGAAITVQFVKPQGLALLAPTTATTGIPASCDATSYLPCSLSAKTLNSNVVTCTLPFEVRDQRAAKFVFGHIAPGNSFVNVVSSEPSPCMSADECSWAIDDLTRRLKLPHVQYRTNKSGDLLIVLPSLARVSDPESVALCISMITAMKSLCRARVEILRNPSRSEMFAFFARAVGYDCEWDIKSRAESTTVYTPHPERFSEAIKGMFRAIFCKQLLLVREPEELQGEYLLSTEQAQRQVQTKQFSPMEFEHILPPGFGQPPIVKQHGNRLIVYSMTKCLPDTYKASVAADLRGISVPVLLREDMRASLVSDVHTLEDIVVRSLPAGIYLRGIIETEKSFILKLTNLHSDRVAVKQVLQQISRCCSKDLSLVPVTSTPDFRDLMSRLASDNDKRFFALAVNEDSLVADAAQLKRLFLSLFDYRKALPRGIEKLDSGSLESIKDLTSLHCFSIDNEDTRVREDAFSVEQLPGGGFRFGIHIAAGSTHIAEGSTADVLARRRGVSGIVDLEGVEYSFRLFSEPWRKLFDLSPHHDSPVFTLRFDTDNKYVIKSDSYQLSLSRIRNREPLAFTEAARLLSSARARLNKRPIVQALKHLEALVRTQAMRSSSFDNQKGAMKIRDVTHELLSIFNTYAEKLLVEAGIAMPPQARSANGSFTVKFNGPVRNYQVLLAQRQLDKLLRAEEPMSASEMAQQVKSCGPDVEGASALQLINTADHLRVNAPSAVLRLGANGGLDLLERADGSTSQFIAPTQAEGEGDRE